MASQESIDMFDGKSKLYSINFSSYFHKESFFEEYMFYEAYCSNICSWNFES